NWYPTEQKRQIVYPVAEIASRAELFCLSGLEVEHSTQLQKRLFLIGEQLGLLSTRDKWYKFQPSAYSDKSNYIFLETGTDQVFVKDHDVSVEEFEQALWEDYLKLSGMRAQFPVLYPSLRNHV